MFEQKSESQIHHVCDPPISRHRPSSDKSQVGHILLNISEIVKWQRSSCRPCNFVTNFHFKPPVYILLIREDPQLSLNFKASFLVFYHMVYIYVIP